MNAIGKGVCMARRDDGRFPTNERTTAEASGAPGVETFEERVVAFAEQLGRLVGTVQAKTEGWMDREALRQQIAKVRDGAADLLDQLTGDAATPSTASPTRVRTAPSRPKVRSGGVVDAPGKKHRKPVPTDPKAKAAARQAANLRAARSIKRTPQRRRRG
jgi:hypothetical protein